MENTGKRSQELSLKGFVQEFRDASTRKRKRKFCFILGAGASVDSKIPAGRKLVERWDQDLSIRFPEAHTQWKKEMGITAENMDQFYSAFYDRRYEGCPEDGYSFLEEIMDQAKPSLGYVMLSYILTESENRVVITTNFDHLVEDSVRDFTHDMPLVISHEAIAHQIPPSISRPTVIKIHRDLLLSPKSSTADIKALAEEWHDPLDRIFREYHPVFIGYAGNDPSLMTYLKENQAKFQDTSYKGWRKPYWLLYQEKGSRIIPAHIRPFLDDSGAYHIWHTGFDNTLRTLALAYGYKVPTQEEFLKVSIQRYKALFGTIEQSPSATSGKQTQTDAPAAMVTTADSPDTAPNPAEAPFEAPQPAAETNSAPAQYQTARLLLADGKYEDACSILRQLIDSDQDNPQYHDILSAALHKMGHYEEALAETQKAIELEPNNARFHDSLSTTLHEMGHYDEALAETQKAIELEPNNARFHNSLGITLHKMGRYGEALAETQKAIELEPNNARFHNSLGITLHKMGRYGEALAEKQKAIELEPNNARFHDSLSATLHKMGHYEEALAEKQKAIELEPNNARFHDSLSATLHKMGHYEEALAETQKAIELEPNNARFHDSLSTTLHEMGHYGEALAETQKAIELEPNNARFHNSLGITLHKMGRYGEALAEKQKAIELEPNNAWFHYSCALSLQKLGRCDEARVEQRKAIELEPNNPEWQAPLE